MITCRPKSTAFFALVVFLIIIFTLLVGTIRMMSFGPEWYHFLMLAVFSIIAIAMLLRMMFSYKTVTFTKNKVKSNYPLRFHAQESYELRKELLYWADHRKQVQNVSFLEVELKMKYGNSIRVNERAHTNTVKVLKHLRSNYASLHLDKMK